MEKYEMPKMEIKKIEENANQILTSGTSSSSGTNNPGESGGTLESIGI